MHSQGKVTMGLAQVGGAVEVRGSGPLIKLSMRVPSSARMLRRQLQRRIVTPTLKKGNFQKKKSSSYRNIHAAETADLPK